MLYENRILLIGITVAFSILFTSLVGCSSNKSNVKTGSIQAPSPKPVYTPKPTETPKPIETPKATETPKTETPKPIETPKAENNDAILPGVTSSDIKLNFKNFTFSGPKKVNNTSIDTGKMSKDGISYTITIFGDLPMKVNCVKFDIDCSGLIGKYTEKDIGSLLPVFLDYCSSLPYDNADPAKAKIWVDNNISKVKVGAPVETKIDKVYLALYGNYPYVMTLEMNAKAIVGN